jgi:hypothetical protein
MADSLENIVTVMRAQELNARQLAALPNAIGTGTGFRQTKGKLSEEVVVQLFVERKYPVAHLPDWARAPREVTGPDGERIPVDVIEVGFVYAAQDTTRYRPVPGGCSIGHQNAVDASTLGGWACDNTDDTIVLLTCNHCIANLGVASVPGGIVQPGRLDGGVVPGDLIGNLKRFIPITTGVVPLPVSPVDAAVGTITVARTDNVLNIGPAIYELGAPALGMAVQKRGRTTFYTSNGSITSVGVQVNVNYGGGVTGRIGNAFIVTSTDGNAFANRGDSGSLIFDQAAGELEGTFPVVGMFFAVSNGGVTTWHNDINVIFNQLNLATVCTCAARALIAAIFGGAAGSESGTASGGLVARKEKQLRRLRDAILRESKFGGVVEQLLGSEIARLSQAVTEDEEAFGMAVRSFAPWVKHETNYELLNAKLDARTIKHLGRLMQRVAEVQPALKEKVRMMEISLAAVEGMRVRDILEAGKILSEKPGSKGEDEP